MTTIETFSMDGFSTLSRFFSIETLQDAEILDQFLGTGDVSESFLFAGPGTYYILFDNGWDRSGSYRHIIVKKMLDVVRPAVFLAELERLNAIYEHHNEPFALARTLRSKAERDALSPADLALLDRMDTGAVATARENLLSYLES